MTRTTTKPARLLAAVWLSLAATPAALLAGCATTTTTDPAAVDLGVTVSQTTYPGGDNLPNRASVYAPWSEAPLPAVVLLHGGGWVSGSPDALDDHARALAERGFVVAAVEYTLTDSTATRFPAAVHDVKAAVRWLRANAAEFNADPTRIAAVGGSAGGHLAALLATSAGVEELEGRRPIPNALVTSRVQAAVGWGTPFDLEALADVDPDDWDGVLATFLGGTIRDVPEAYRLASPATHADPTDPPILLIHERDERVAFPQAQERAFRAAARTVPGFEVIEFRGDEHAFWVRERDGSDRFVETIDLTVSFLRDALAVPAPQAEARTGKDQADDVRERRRRRDALLRRFW